ncbi:MAG: efflux RND transporter permease subunit, partial [Planctomycetales bacterium]|nr:efflux RND transporter permease subunit [Planctomycetales bacterium]
MLNSIIKFALRQPMLVVALATLIIVVGLRETWKLPIDVFPDLNRPRVVVITEATGYAPEDIETRINIPLESALNGATGVEAVRSSAGEGISVIFVEFEWGTDIFTDRQVVNERIEVAKSQLPSSVQPQLAPISSIMGQIMLLGMYVDAEEAHKQRAADGHAGDEAASDGEADRPPTSLLELREIADWTIRRRLMNIRGIAQVFTMGGEKGGERQVQVLVNPNQLRRTGVTFHQVEEALR